MDVIAPLAGLLDLSPAEEESPVGMTGRLDEATLALLGRLEVRDTDLPLLRGSTTGLNVVLGGGAGQIAGPAALADKLGLRLAGIRVALRDYDDLAGNVRRVAAAVDAARADHLDAEVPIAVELPIAESPYGWQAALDEIAAAELQAAFRLGDAHGGPTPDSGQVAEWIDASLDRETPFVLARGVDRAVRDQQGHGLLNVLLACQAAWDGLGAGAVADLLDERDAQALAERVPEATSARRWLRSVSTAAGARIAEDVRVLALFT